MRVFIIECPNPIDLLQGRTEGKSLEQICSLVGHEVTSFHPKSQKDLSTVCRYISSIDREHDGTDNPDLPLCVHISCHGEEDGLLFGKDLIRWKKLLKALEPIFEKKSVYRGDKILTISACQAREQKLTAKLQRWWKNNRQLRPPEHLFVTASEDVYWNDAVVAWALFYSKIPRTKLTKKRKIIKVLEFIEKADLGCLHYYKWSKKNGSYRGYCCGGDSWGKQNIGH